MSKAAIIDGKEIAAGLARDVALRVAALKEKGVQPGFAAVMVGDHAPSQIYVANKRRAMERAGIVCDVHQLPMDTKAADVLELLDRLNADAGVHGILVQLPLPPHLDALEIINRIAPDKDADGLTMENVGRRTLGLPGLLPCTPKGCIKLIKSIRSDLAGLHAVVVGRSDLVGKPMGQLLLREDCTVTQTHAGTRDLPALLKQADIVVVAAGQAEMIQGDWIKPGAIVIDVGINRVEGGLTGDVHFASAVAVAGAITPVPGGVGPMTIACLLENVVEAAESA